MRWQRQCRLVPYTIHRNDLTVDVFRRPRSRTEHKFCHRLMVAVCSPLCHRGLCAASNESSMPLRKAYPHPRENRVGSAPTLRAILHRMQMRHGSSNKTPIHKKVCLQKTSGALIRPQAYYPPMTRRFARQRMEQKPRREAVECYKNRKNKTLGGFWKMSSP